MISGISSLVKGDGSRAEGAVAGLAHVGGALLGGATMASVVWLLATPLRTFAPQAVDLFLVAVLACVVILAELERFPLPRQPRQVPQRWYVRYGLVRSYGLYGFWLGAGLATSVTYAIEYLVFAAAALLLSLPEALSAGAIFGLGRAVLVGPLGVMPPLSAMLVNFYRRREGVFTVVSIILAACVLVVALASVVT